MKGEQKNCHYRGRCRRYYCSCTASSNGRGGGLPCHIGGSIENREDLLVQTAEGMAAKFNLRICPFHEAVSINRQERFVVVRNLETDEMHEETYDQLILSAGASPVKPPIPGIEEARKVYTLRSIPDTDRIIKEIVEHLPQKSVIIGGSFIGVEMAENLHERGIHVTLVEMQDQIMPGCISPGGRLRHHC